MLQSVSESVLTFPKIFVLRYGGRMKRYAAHVASLSFCFFPRRGSSTHETTSRSSDLSRRYQKY